MDPMMDPMMDFFGWGFTDDEASEEDTTNDEAPSSSSALRISPDIPSNNGASNVGSRRIAPLKKKAAKSKLTKPKMTLPPLDLSLIPTTPPRVTRSMTAVKNAVSPLSLPDSISTPASIESLSDNAKWAVMSSRNRENFVGAKASKEIEPDGEFWRFPSLPAEIQFMIWKAAMVGRIVKLNSAKVPGIAHACHDSRRLAKYIFKTAGADTCLFINPEYDVLLLDRSSFSAAAYYHSNAYHTLNCSRIKQTMFRNVERLAVSLEEIHASMSDACLHCFMTKRLPQYFWNIKEFIIILRPGPLGSDYEDLWDCGDTSDNVYTQRALDELKHYYKAAQKEEVAQKRSIVWKEVALKFMRLEKWTR